MEFLLLLLLLMSNGEEKISGTNYESRKESNALLGGKRGDDGWVDGREEKQDGRSSFQIGSVGKKATKETPLLVFQQRKEITIKGWDSI